MEIFQQPKSNYVKHLGKPSFRKKRVWKFTHSLEHANPRPEDKIFYIID